MNRNLSSRWILSILALGLSVSAELTATEPRSELTLKQIMADPDWIALSPQSPQWDYLSQSIVYQAKISGHKSNQFFRVVPGQAQPKLLSAAEIAALPASNGSYSADGKSFAYVQGDSLFVQNSQTGEITPVYTSSDRKSQVQFLTDGRLSFRQEQRFLVLDFQKMSLLEILEIKNGNKPKDWSEPKDFLGAQQRRLFEVVTQKQDERQFQKQLEQERQEASPFAQTQTLHIGEGNELVTMSLSPNGRFALLVTQKKSADGKADNMPHFVTEDGYVRNEPVRDLVGTAESTHQSFQIVELATGKMNPLDLSSIDGMKDDPMRDFKKAAAKRNGEKYKAEDKLRDVYLHAWFNAGLVWSTDGSQLALRVYSSDNKDLWYLSVDFERMKPVLQHRLQNKAWVNDWTFNDFGWLSDNRSFYYLSEQTGYSHLYLKQGKKARALTQGNYEVSDLTASKDGKSIYFKANREHPGKYEIFKVSVEDAKISQLTNFEGMTDYVLSPDEQKLALLHSSLTRPAELYWLDISQQSTPQQLTDTVSPGFKAIDWVAPQIVEVPSSHAKQPIYSKIYLPKDFDAARSEAYPAVMFVHGAGYLQNSHFGWSGYFREFMFHNLLLNKGYVVIDMDYRASKGYGADWRTAIYQQMGTPELQDFIDGKNYLVKNFNVDAKRMGIYGGSYGGFMTFMALFNAPGEFAAGASLRPVTDWASYNHGYTSNILNTPELDPDAYNRSSPIEFAAGLADPLLIAHGMVDDNVFFKDSVRLVQRLIELEKTALFELAVYPVEPHGFREPSSWLDEYTRIFLLFERHLK